MGGALDHHSIDSKTDSGASGEVLSPQARGTSALPGNGGRETLQELGGRSSQVSDMTIDDDQSTIKEEEQRPPLPPRPSNLDLLGEHPKSPKVTLQRQHKSIRPHLQSKATTALSLTDIHSHIHPDTSRETYANSNKSGKSPKIQSPVGHFRGYNESEAGDSASIRSYAPTLETGGDVESLLGEVLGQQSPAWKLLSSQAEVINPFDLLSYEDDQPTADFNREFDELSELDADGNNEGTLFLNVAVKNH